MRALRFLTVILGLLLVLALGLLLGMDNSSEVRLAFLGWHSPELPLFLWLCLALLTGILIGAGLVAAPGLRHRFARGRAERQLAASRKEVQDLRRIALDD